MIVELKDVCNKDTSNIRQKDIIDKSGDYPIYGASGLVGNVNFYQQEKESVAVVKDGAGIGRVMLLPAKASIIGTMQYLIPKENILPEYLYYAVRNMHLEKYYSGATIPHIYFKDYQKEKINLVSLKQQREIVTLFNSIENAINKKKNELSKLNTLIKARFVEMFGDPLRNDRTWPISKLKLLTTKIGSGATPKGGKQSYKKEGITLVRSMNVHDGEFVYKDLAHIDTAQAHDLDNVELQPKDVFINITGASVARSCVIPDNILPGRVNQHVAIIRCKENLLNYIFLNRLFLNSSFKQKLLAMGQAGGATRQALTKEQLKKLNLILPPIELQNEFASFVQQVDKSKVVIQKSLDETQTLFDSLMQKYFS
jgi:type I restriction enzyme S subunit